MIMAQVKLPGNAGLDEVSLERKTIKRQPMKDRSKSIKYDVQQERYDGPKKPAIPPEQALNHIPILSFLASQAIAVQRAVENDFVFHRTYILNQNVLITMGSILDYVEKPACFLNTRLTLLSYHLLTAPLLTMTPPRLQ